MQIVMVGPFGLRPKGTMSVRALPLARALADRGHQVTLLLPPWSYPQDSGRRWQEDGVTVENVPLPPLPSLWPLTLTGRLARRVLALRPQVVHCFKPKAYAGLVHYLLWWRRRLPRGRGSPSPRLVVDTDDWEGPGGWNEVVDPTTGRPTYSWPQRRLFAWQERWGLTHADRITVASRALETLVWSLGVPPEHVVYLPNGVGVPPPPAPRPHRRREGPPTLLLYTRFFEFDPARPLRVLQRVRETVPQARLLVVGKGLFGEEETLLRLAQAMGLAQAVHYVGWVEPQALGDHFAEADLALYPFDDTLINRTKCAVKLLDLMAWGLPVVADAVGENAQMIVHGESGWLVPPGDVEAMAAAVIHLLQQAPLRQRLGEGARRRVMARYTWEHLAAYAEEAYGFTRR